MSIQEFQRWAEGQRVPASLRTLVSPKLASSELIDDHDGRRVEASASTEGSSNGARRFLGTLRWGK